LIVDDFEPLLASLRRSFEREGFQSACFDSCEAALAELRQHPQRFAAVISDVTLPGMSGIEFARKVRESHPDLPIVLMSGDESAAGLKGLGPRTLFLRKPFVPGAISEWLRSLGVNAQG
jgi:DNA-binding NtrC family response regulator